MRILLNKFVKRVSLTRTTTDLTCPASTLSSVSARHYILKKKYNLFTISFSFDVHWFFSNWCLHLIVFVYKSNLNMKGGMWKHSMHEREAKYAKKSIDGSNNKKVPVVCIPFDQFIIWRIYHRCTKKDSLRL